MKNSNVKNNTLTNNTPLLSQGALGALDRSNSLAANPAQQRPASMDQAKSLDEGAKHNSLRKNQANTEPKAFEYDLTGLMQLPNEMKHAIFSKLDQKDLENFFEAIEKHVLLGMAAIASAKPISDTTQACKDLLAMALMSFSQDIHFNKTIDKMLRCAKRLGINNCFERSPSLHVDFSSGALKEFSYTQFKDFFKGTKCGFKNVVLQGLKEEELVFSTKGFPKLEALKIEEADALKVFELDDRKYTCEKMELIDCKELRKVDVQDASQLRAFTCTNAENLEELSVDSKSWIESFNLTGCSLDKLNLELLAQGLENNCTKLNLNGCLSRNTLKLVRYISSLKNLEDLNLYHLPITDVNFLNSLTHLKKVDLSCSLDSFEFTSPLNLSALIKLKEIDLSGRTLDHISFLSALSSLEKIKLSGSSLGSEAISEALRPLRDLKVLNLEDNFFITDLNFLEPLSQLEELNLNGCPQIKKSSFAVLAGLTKLKKLILDSNFEITDLDFLKSLANLKELSLGDYPKLKREAWTVLRNLPKLKSLDLSRCTYSGLFIVKCLKGCPSLEELSLTPCFSNGNPEAFKSIADLPQLRKLNLANTEINDLSILKPLVLLQELNVSGCELLDEAQVEAFQALRPQCKVLYRMSRTISSESSESSESEGENEPFLE